MKRRIYALFLCLGLAAGPLSTTQRAQAALGESADSVETWTGPFRNFEVSAKSTWDYPEALAARREPVRGSWQLHYRYDPNTLFIRAGQFETPSSHGTVDGLLAPRPARVGISRLSSTQ